jgi:2-isopropylmalate synthase
MPLDGNLLPETLKAISKAAKPRINVIAPVSTVQMEYHCHQKPAAVLEKISSIVSQIKAANVEVEISLADATRAENDFLTQAVKTAITAGADVINVCDSAGMLFPGEMYDFISDLQKNVPELLKNYENWDLY